MDYQTFVRKPFTVEAVEITKENIEEVAELVGEVRYKPDGTPYIQVNRRLVPNLWQVYIGYWMTKMGDNIRCYSKKIFKEQFVENTSDIQNWIDFLNKKPDEVKVGDYGQIIKEETPVVPGTDG